MPWASRSSVAQADGADDAELVVAELLAVLEVGDDAVDEVIDAEFETLALYEEFEKELDTEKPEVAVAEAEFGAVLTDASCEELTAEDTLALDIPTGRDDEGYAGIHLAKMVDAEAMKEIQMTG
ncbi:hypothetical protein PG994_008842 [Apiospora phragmitis]|uniref:Uncharacterized protein n=1 Tax=Apiospora phragmitis TaxID=2905665 RepID=A0ABR1UHL1_9PEZI